MKNYMATITRVLLAGTAALLSADSALSANPRSLSGVVQTGGTSSSQALPNVGEGVGEVCAASGPAQRNTAMASIRDRIGTLRVCIKRFVSRPDRIPDRD